MYKKRRYMIIVLLLFMLFINGCGNSLTNNKSEEENTIGKNVNNNIIVDNNMSVDIDEGFLLALRKDIDSKNFEQESAEYRTLYIYKEGQAMKVIEIKDEVLIQIDGIYYRLRNDNSVAQKLLDGKENKKEKFTDFDYEHKIKFNNIVIEELGDKDEKLYTEEEFRKKANNSKWPIQNLNEKIVYLDEDYICIEGNTYSSNNVEHNKDYYVEIYNTNDFNERKKLTFYDELKLEKEFKKKIENLEKKYNQIIIEEKYDGKVVFSEMNKIDNRYLVLTQINGNPTFAIPLVNEKINYNNNISTIIPEEFIPITCDKELCEIMDEVDDGKIQNTKKMCSDSDETLTTASGEIKLLLKDNKLYLCDSSNMEEKKAFFSLDLEENEKLIMSQIKTNEEKNKCSQILKDYVSRDLESSNIKVESEKIIEQEEGVYEIEVLLPKIKLENKQIENDINNIISEDLRLAQESLVKIAGIDRDNLGLDFNEYYIKTDFKVNVISEDILSLQVIVKESAGLDYELEYINSYNFNINTGEKVDLGDIFEEGYDYSDAIKRELLISISNSENEGMYKEDILEMMNCFEKFYLTGNNELVIYFGQNEIAPISEGVQEFIIPFDAFESRIVL